MKPIALLDSRVRDRRNVRAIGRNLGVVAYGEPVFCVSCGSVGGHVTIDLPPGVIYLCGECESAFGVPSEMNPRPDLDAAMR